MAHACDFARVLPWPRAWSPTATVGDRAGMPRTGQGAWIAEYFWPSSGATQHVTVRRRSSSVRSWPPSAAM